MEGRRRPGRFPMTAAQEHFTRYEALARRIGIDALRKIVPCPGQVMPALAAGDEHLNTIPLGYWDKAAGMPSALERPKCPRCGQVILTRPTPPARNPNRLSFAAPWLPEVANGLSLSDRVCVLKHVATHHMVAKVAP